MYLTRYLHSCSRKRWPHTWTKIGTPRLYSTGGSTLCFWYASCTGLKAPRHSTREETLLQPEDLLLLQHEDLLQRPWNKSKKMRRGSYGWPVLQGHEPQAPGETNKQVTNHRSRKANDHNHLYGTLSCGEPAGGTHAQDVGALYNNVVQGKTDHTTSTRRALKQRRRREAPALLPFNKNQTTPTDTIIPV